MCLYRKIIIWQSWCPLNEHSFLTIVIDNIFHCLDHPEYINVHADCRYFAIMHPLSLSDAGKRGKIMILLAWSISAVASIPQVTREVGGGGRGRVSDAVKERRWCYFWSLSAIALGNCAEGKRGKKHSATDWCINSTDNLGEGKRGGGNDEGNRMYIFFLNLYFYKMTYVSF